MRAVSNVYFLFIHFNYYPFRVAENMSNIIVLIKVLEKEITSAQLKTLEFPAGHAHEAALLLSGIVDAFSNLQTVVDDEIEKAYLIGALAMTHHYHGEYASVGFKADHAEGAMREEHIEWAKENIDKIFPADIK